MKFQQLLKRLRATARKNNRKDIMKKTNYSFYYRSRDGHIMRPESFLNINKGRTLSGVQLRALGITKIKKEEVDNEQKR